MEKIEQWHKLTQSSHEHFVKSALVCMPITILVGLAGVASTQEIAGLLAAAPFAFEGLRQAIVANMKMLQASGVLFDSIESAIAELEAELEADLTESR